jgi:hypothetical protein
MSGREGDAAKATPRIQEETVIDEPADNTHETAACGEEAVTDRWPKVVTEECIE